MSEEKKDVPVLKTQVEQKPPKTQKSDFIQIGGTSVRRKSIDAPDDFPLTVLKPTRRLLGSVQKDSKLKNDRDTE